MSLSDSRLEAQALTLLEAALEQPPDERRAWAEASTDHDPSLRTRLLALLAAAGRSGGLKTGGAVADAPELPPPGRIGAYRIVEQLGRGGMGAVYRAERDAGDFNHTVAIKVIRPGALSDALIERFGRERQTLADLPHPNIARLYDGGQTADGQPYIVMELVDGRPITDWAREHALPLRSRLALFLSACEAVRFAHQNLIVHRDLTPANVLVTAEGQVKLIDFGIARAQDLEPATDGPRAALAAMSLTPGFAAPERLAGAGATTLVDIYSLGRLLADLLEDLPPDPDLRAIAARAAAERPEERYASVDALMDDVRRRLDGRAVAARGAGRGYVLGKFVRRHRRTVAASSTAAVLLIAALAVTLYAYGAATRAREAEARRFAELRSLAGYMIFDLNGQLARVAGNTGARVELAAQAQRYLSRLAAASGDDAELRQEAARGLVALAHVQGVPGQPNLGQYEPARANLLSALGLLEETGVSGVPEAAGASVGLAMLNAHNDGDLPAAAARLREAQGALDSAPGAQRDGRWHLARGDLLRAQLDLAVLDNRVGDIVPLAERLEREVAKWPLALRGSREAQHNLAYAEYNRAVHGYLADELERAVGHAREAETRLLRLDAERTNDPDTLYLLAWTQYMGYGAASGVDPDEADRFLQRAEKTIERLLRSEAKDRSLYSFGGQIAQARAQALSAEGRHGAAIETQQRVIARFAAALGPDRKASTLNRLTLAHGTLSRIALKAGDRSLVCASLRRAEALAAELEGRGDLMGHTAASRAAVQPNLARCARGEPLSRFTSGD